MDRWITTTLVLTMGSVMAACGTSEPDLDRDGRDTVADAGPSCRGCAASRVVEHQLSGN